MVLKEFLMENPTAYERENAWDAARRVAWSKRPALVVLNDDDYPVAVLSTSRIVSMIVPRYIRDDHNLAHVLRGSASEEIMRTFGDKTVGDVVAEQERHREVPILNVDDTTIEAAVLMASLISPIIALVENGRYAGVVSGNSLLRHILKQSEGNE